MLAFFTAVCLMAGCAHHGESYMPEFNYKHIKARRCDEFWLSFERLKAKSNAVCEELYRIDGFPYLRGTASLLENGLKLNNKNAISRWLELLRTSDLQARYRELDALSDTDWALLCSRAGIMNCEAGRVKAFTARCSALLLGDERGNPDMVARLKRSAAHTLETGKPDGTTCFKDSLTLDGAIPDDLFKALTNPDRSYRGSSVLEQRLNRIKSTTGNRFTR